MIPGMNKKQMKQMERQMKKMGMKIMGQETYQIEGQAREVELEYEIEIPDEDIEMVANSANVSEDEARQALEECKGDLAEAIMKLNQ